MVDCSQSIHFIEKIYKKMLLSAIFYTGNRFSKFKNVEF